MLNHQNLHTMVGFLRFCSIVSICVASLKLAMLGGLTSEMTTFVMICAMLVIFGTRRLFIIATATAGLVLFIKVYGGDSKGQNALLQGVLALAFAVFGLYIIIRGLIPGGRNRY